MGTSEWRYGQPTRGNLGGTARTLDEVDGRCDLGTGVISEVCTPISSYFVSRELRTDQSGVSVIDDSKSMLFTSDGFVAARTQDVGRSDIYIFGYGQDYREALNAYYTISGSAPVLPRWAFGNWWSRFCKSPCR
jgi:alpha-glucosidase (family GH31 glycosyl hydrolase)